MIINREYSDSFFFENVLSDEFIIVSAPIDDGSDGDSFFQKLKQSKSNCEIVSFDYRITVENSVISDSFFTHSSDAHSSLGSNVEHPISDLGIIVREINNKSKKIIVDFTIMHLRFLGALVAVMNSFQWESLFFTYSEPISYPREKTQLLETKKRIAGFDLYSTFFGYSQIPFLSSIDIKRNKCTWIVFLGFEGKRAGAIYNELSDFCETIIPVITYPSIRPGWANYTYDANRFLFCDTFYSQCDILYIDALNPFQAYSFIEKRYSEHSENGFVVSPFSSRPISLGVFLFAMKNERCEVYYDNPERAHSDVKNNGAIHFYDLLDFFVEYSNSAKEESQCVD